jgi:predicted transcriptional regulator
LGKSEGEDVRKLLRQVFLIRIALIASFAVALAATALLFVPSLSSLPGYGHMVASPVNQTVAASTYIESTQSQTTYAATTATVTFSFSSTASHFPGPYSVAPQSTIIPYTANYYGFTALISWIVFGAALIWRGRVRSVWGKSRFSYDTFRLLVKMRGAHTRLNLMRSLNPPKNKLQLATALGIDWKAVDRHVQVLKKNALIQVAATNGTATYYETTQKGKDLIALLEQLDPDNPASN